MSEMERRSFLSAAFGTSLAAMTSLRAAEAANDPMVRNRQGMKPMTLAAVAQRSWPASPERNLESTQAWVEKAQAAEVDLVCFPEISITGYVTTPDIWKAAEPVPGPSTERLAEFAEKSGLIIAAGIAEKDRDLVYDTYVFVGPQGYIGKSRKIHIPPAEVGYWRGGGIPPVIDIGLARIGVNICFDNWLPESSRLVGLQGAEVVFAPFVWSVGEWGPNPDHRRRNRAWKDYAGRTFPARAIDNGIFLVAVNSVGPVPNGPRQYYGNPVVLVYSPHGQLVAETPDEASNETMVVTRLDSELLAQRRSQAVFHPRFRRPELYHLLCQGDIGAQDPK